MASQRDVTRIALSLPETSQDQGSFHFRVRGEQFAWVWHERIAPNRARVPNPGVLAVRVAHDINEQVLLASDSKVFFTEPHYDGYPAVLVRLPAIDLERLRELLTQAWECQAPRELTGGTTSRNSSRGSVPVSRKSSGRAAPARRSRGGRGPKR